MRLFWKIFAAVFFSFVATASYISYIIVVRQISDAQKSLINENKTIATFISKEIEVSYLEFRWPFESLKKLSEREDFLFWWISREDGIIHLADKASFMGTNAYAYFPRKLNPESLILNSEQNYGLLIQPIKTGERNWIFWLGFSTRGISKIKKSIILLHLIVSLSALLILGAVLYFLINHFTRPIKELAIGAQIIGKGNLTHRVRIASKDELGQLAASFNQMADDLQKTTVSRDYVDNIITSMIDALMVIDPETKIKTVNRAACELLGYRQEELIGKPVKVIFASEQMPLGLIEKGELRNYETYYKAKNGKEIPVLFNASVMKDKAGKINSIVCTGRDITERKQAEDQIKASLKEKELLLKEIHHRVKNNLQVISSLLNLQAGYIKDTQALELFQESQNRIKSMALIHEKLYRSQNLAKIDFKEYIHNLTNYLFRSYRAFSNNIVPKIKVDNIYLGIDTAIPCGLIINELVSNAMKHAFPAGKTGKIWINFSATTNRRHSDKLVLSVRDNGVGFPRDLDFRNTESLGLQLVNTLTKQLKGTIELDRSRGTKFKITFPEPTSKLVHVSNYY